MHRHIPSLIVPVASGTFRNSLCQSPAAPSESHCASRQWHLLSLSVPVASGTFQFSLSQSPTAPFESYCTSRQRHLLSLTVPVASGTSRVSLCQSPTAPAVSTLKVMCFDTFTVLFSLPGFNAVMTGKYLPTFRINFVPPSSG